MLRCIRELAAFNRLAALGLGTVTQRNEDPSPEVFTISAGEPYSDGSSWCHLGVTELEQMCSQATVCPRSYTFTPSDLGIELSQYLRNLLVAMLIAPKT